MSDLQATEREELPAPGVAARGSCCATALVVLALASALAPGAGAAPQGAAPTDAPADPLERRAADVSALFRADPGGYEDLFAPEFLAKVPAAQLTAIFTDYFQRLGRCTGRRIAERQGAASAKYDFIFEKGYSVPVTLTIDAAPPQRIAGLWLGNPVRLAASIEDVLTEVRSLPGRVSLLLMRLGDREAKPLASIDPDVPLAVGSTFKLYVLGELVREVDEGKRQWEEVVRVRSSEASLPSGILQTWPDGSPVTLHTLATLMISMSDNTATDRLIDILGRERVEAAQRTMGHSHPERNMPFLTTAEAFRLKGTSDLGDAYEAADVAGRRALLAGRARGISLDALAISPSPQRIQTVEWFASASDLCRAMDWLRTGGEAGAGGAARAILAIHTAIDLPKSAWEYVGYKGGSEPGVVNVTFLLRAAGSGDWYALSAAWNRTDGPVDEGRLAGLAQRLLQLVPGVGDGAQRHDGGVR